MRTINLELPVLNTIRTLHLELSDEVYERAQEVATENKVSINSLVATALVKNILVPTTEMYFAEQCQKKTPH